jgi:small subunit ribosomal protein S6
MNHYENIVILDASLADEEVEAAITKIKEFVTGQGGEIVKVSIWGKRKLSYEINRQKRGLYVFLVYKTPSATIKKLEEFYKVFDAVIKYSIIRLGAKQIENLEKAEAANEPVEQKRET